MLGVLATIEPIYAMKHVAVEPYLTKRTIAFGGLKLIEHELELGLALKQALSMR